MQINWKAGLLVAATLLIGAAYFLYPTVTYFSLSPDQLKEVRENKEAFKKFIPAWSSESHIVPGLDLQGGIHMVLGVDLEKAVSDKARRAADRMKSELEDKGVGYTEIEHVTDPETDYGDRIRVMFKDEAAKDRYDADVSKYFGDMEIVSQGDNELLLRVDPNYVTTIKNDAVDQTIKTIRNRIDKMGVTEPSIQKRGDDQIQIQLPGYSNPEEAKSLIGRTAQLEFYMLEDESDFMTKLSNLPEGVTMRRSGFSRPDGGFGNDIYLEFKKSDEKQKEVKKYLSDKYPPGITVKYGEMPVPGEDPLIRTFTLKKQVEITGDDLVDARVALGSPENPRPFVSIDFSVTGGRRFGELTTNNVGRRMAIVLEDEVNSAPVINEPITGGSAQITMGGGTREEMIKEANDLSLVLKAGALPAPVSFREERVVGASLGEEAVERGANASLIGLALIVLFMLAYYRVSGVIAVVGLVFNLAFVLGTISWLGGTVTLPGIAGLLLTVGMAVDANIIIMERIREELIAGKTPRSAVASGYEHALSAILDANVTTFIAGLVLWNFGTGPIQNFATTLLIGVVASVVSAVFITRIFFDMYVASGREKISI
jgi:preprotein translocase subunit SecD